MRSRTDQRFRGRPNGQGRFQQQPRLSQNNQIFDSNGPNMRVRGTAHQIFERYLAIAREAETGGDRVAAESYYQHAEHYFHINNGSRDRNAQETSRPTAPADVVTRCADTGSTEIGIDRAQSGSEDYQIGFGSDDLNPDP
jgi:uncharacterized protein DUF4167